VSTGTIDAAPGMHRTLSIRMREGLSVYDLKELELRLAHILVLETFDRDQTRAKIELRRWAKVLGLVEAKGPREDKALALFNSLVDLDIVDANAGDGMYELRPAMENWSRLRALRIKQSQAAHPELPNFSAERPLSEALSDVSREKALQKGPVPRRDWSHLFSKLAQNINDPDALQALMRENFPEPSSGATENERRINPPTDGEKSRGVSADYSADWRPGEKTTVNPGALLGGLESADYSAAPIASLAPVKTAKLAIPANSPAPARTDPKLTSAAALRWLQEVDKLGRLSGPFGPQWEEVCAKHPKYVLQRLRGAFEDHEKRAARKEKGASGVVLAPVGDPLAWLSRKAREEGKWPTAPGRRVR
jgi:hypothetical protein